MGTWLSSAPRVPLVVVALSLVTLAVSGLLRGQVVEVGFLVVYAAVGLGLLVLTRGSLLVTVVALYLLGPNPANDLLVEVSLTDVQNGFTGRSNVLVLTDLLVLLIILARSGVRPEAGHRWLPALAAVAALPTAAYLWEPQQPATAYLGQAMVFVRGGLLLVLVGQEVRLAGWWRTARSVVTGLVTGTTGLSVLAVVVWLLVGPNSTVSLPGMSTAFVVSYDSRVALPGWGNNILGNVVTLGAVALVFSAYPFGRRLAWCRWPAMAVHLLAILAIGMRTSIVLLVAVSALHWAVPALRRRYSATVLVGGLLAGVVVLAGAAPVLVRLLVEINPRYGAANLGRSYDLLTGALTPGNPSEGSLYTRGVLYRGALSMFRDSPLVGQGWGAWGFVKNDFGVGIAAPLDQHNGWLWALSEGGLVGILVYLVPLALAVRYWSRLGVIGPLTVVVLVLELANPNVSKPLFSAVWWVLAALVLCRATCPEDEMDAPSSAHELREQRLARQPG